MDRARERVPYHGGAPLPRARAPRVRARRGPRVGRRDACGDGLHPWCQRLGPHLRRRRAVHRGSEPRLAGRRRARCVRVPPVGRVAQVAMGLRLLVLPHARRSGRHQRRAQPAGADAARGARDARHTLPGERPVVHDSSGRQALLRARVEAGVRYHPDRSGPLQCEAGADRVPRQVHERGSARRLPAAPSAARRPTGRAVQV